MRYSALSMALAGPIAVYAASGTGQTTRYWDCCKPSCAWDGKADVSAPVLTCDANDNPLSDDNAVSGCDGGTAYTCSNNSPWAVNDNLAYGFAATKISGGSESSWCCACYALTFTSGAVQGKTLIVQSTNTGSDLGDNHFDLLMPGGGVGIFDGCTSEFGTALPGDQYGGISSESQCSSFPAVLQDGCDWRFDWFENADNPSVSFEQVQCPTALTDISGCIRDDDGDYPVFSASGSSGSSSTSTAAVATSSKAASSSAQAVSSQAPSSEVISSQATSYKASTTTAPQQTDVVESQASTVQSETVVQTKAPTTELAQTSTSQGIQTRTRASSKASGCAARKSTTLASVATVSAASASTSTVAIYHQCNGSKDLFPNGALPCASGSTCVYSNDYYSQCQPN